MNVSAAYTWKTDGCSKRDKNPLLPSNIRGLVIGKSNCGKQLYSYIYCYNHTG